MEKISINSSEFTRDTLKVTSEFVSSATSQLGSDFTFVVLDCYSYIAGEKVTGEVLLNISEALPQGLLSFLASGQEEVTVYDSQDRAKIVTEENAEIFSIEGALHSWEQLPPGQYVFPFTLKIPHYSPSTFYFASADQRGFYVKAQVSYSIKTQLTTSNPLISLQHIRNILIKNKNALNNSTTSTKHSELLSGCCYNKGVTNFLLSIQNPDHCEVNGDVYYRLTPSNSNCKAPINHVIGKVVMEFTAMTKKGEFKVITNMAKIDRATWISGLSDLIFEKDFEYRSSLYLGENINPSSNVSPLIKCVYYVEMQAFYDIFCRKEPVSIILPFHVNPLNLIPKEIPTLPGLWAPIEAGIAAFYDPKSETIRNSARMSYPESFTVS